jgi:hypothetical protein
MLSGVSSNLRSRVSGDGCRVALRGLRLTSVPKWLRNLTSITNLDLSDNSLTSVQEWSGNLTTLSTLNLSDNYLTSMPESLGNLTALTSLDLAINQLASVETSVWLSAWPCPAHLCPAMAGVAAARGWRPRWS